MSVRKSKRLQKIPVEIDNISPRAQRADSFDPESIGGLHSRFSRFKRPKLGDDSAPPAERHSVDTESSPFMNMPLDVFIGIACLLEPTDLLQLYRVSRRLLRVLSSSNARQVWIAARRNYPPLVTYVLTAAGHVEDYSPIPSCPPDLTEVQYACLLFDDICYSCGVEADLVDYNLRMQFCTSCYEKSIREASTVVPNWEDIREHVCPLLPSAAQQLDRRHRDYGREPYPKTYRFYVPELQFVVARFTELKTSKDTAGLSTFVSEQSKSRTQMMESGEVIFKWQDMRRRANEPNWVLAMERKASIDAKLDDLGWSHAYRHGQANGYTWYNLTYKCALLTPESWANLLPLLTAIYQKNASRHLENTKLWSFRAYWQRLIAGKPLGEDTFDFPFAMEAEKFPTLVAIVAERNPDKSPIQMAEYLSKTPELQQYKNDVRDAFYGLLSLPETSKPEMNAALASPSALFSCVECAGRSRYPGADHIRGWRECLKHSHQSHWHTPDFYAHDDRTTFVVDGILKDLNLSSNSTTLASLTRSKFSCRCGDVDLDGLSFEMLVLHILKERKWFDKMQEASAAAKIRLGNSYKGGKLVHVHGRRGLITVTPKELVEKEPVAPVKMKGKAKLCVHCCDIMGSAQAVRDPPFDTEGEATHHMKVKHGRKFVKNDLILRTDYIESRSRRGPNRSAP